MIRRRGKRGPYARAHRRKMRWSQFELRVLHRYWGELQPRRLRARLPGRSWVAIFRMAATEGLTLGVPRGYVSLHDAARRLGYSHASVVRALAQRAGVEVFRHDCKLRPSDTGKAYVEWDAILSASEREVRELEVLGPAAVRRGINAGRLWTWVRDEGLLPPLPEGRARRGPVRLPTAVIDDLVARHRSAA